MAYAVDSVFSMMHKISLFFDFAIEIYTLQMSFCWDFFYTILFLINLVNH